jgi:hypothetical protein
MDALFRSLLVVGALASLGAGYRTPNFVVTAPSEKIAKQVGEAAEVYRKQLAIDWTGSPLPGNWSSPCPISVHVGMMGARGETKFNFQNGEVYGWKMEIYGSEERILDSVLPHEINHTIFASHFRRPLPRWADEGAASLIENESERMRLRKIHDQVMHTTRKIPLRTLLEMTNYPRDNQEVLTLYAEGHSLADYLIQRSDKLRFVKFLQLAHERDWNHALKTCYQFESIESLEKVWDEWVVAGSPSRTSPKGTLIAVNPQPAPKNSDTIRGQSDELNLPPPLKRPNELDLALNPSPGRLSRQSLELPLLTLPAQSAAARVPRDQLVRPGFTK